MGKLNVGTIGLRAGHPQHWEGSPLVETYGAWHGTQGQWPRYPHRTARRETFRMGCGGPANAK